MEHVIRVRKAPAYATVQDTGRWGFLASGVPRAGAMDLPALTTLNVLLGNDSRAAGIEWALTGGELEFGAATVFAVGGAEASVSLGSIQLDAYRAYGAAAGETLSIDAITGGRFVYIVFAGGIDCGVVMTSRSTYAPGRFGGLEGRRLKGGDVLTVGPSGGRRRHHVSDTLPGELRPMRSRESIRFVPAGGGDTVTVEGRYTVSHASDRTGYRLEGAPRENGASITSAPVCPGVIQLPRGGEPIVLMSDAPTIGGYRIAGAVISTDLGALSQRLPGEAISLAPVTVEQAQKELEAQAGLLAQVREWCISD